tara:strand:- start:28 stop:195 length:168 start_codon:yes stop_codon:yes gene_type:complete
MTFQTFNHFNGESLDMYDLLRREGGFGSRDEALHGLFGSTESYETIDPIGECRRM